MTTAMSAISLRVPIGLDPDVNASGFFFRTRISEILIYRILIFNMRLFMKTKKTKGFRMELNKREKIEALKNLGKPKTSHQVTLCFGGLKFAKAQVELDRAVYRDEFKDLGEYILEQFKPMFNGLTKVIVHN
jgi:hypothetical protein